MKELSIEELKKQLAEAREVIEFYGDVKMWCQDRAFIHSSIVDLDLSEYPNLYKAFQYMVGGKRAREWLKRWGG